MIIAAQTMFCQILSGFFDFQKKRSALKQRQNFKIWLQNRQIGNTICTKLISNLYLNYPCCSIITKIAYDVTIWKSSSLQLIFDCFHKF